MYAYMYAYKKLYRVIHAREKGKNGGQKEECDKKKCVLPILVWRIHCPSTYACKRTLSSQTHTYNAPNVSVLVSKNSNRIFWCYNEDLRKTIYRTPIRSW